MNSEPSISFRLSSPTAPVGAGPNLIYGLVRIDGGASAEVLPSNLGFVLDTSESMRIHLVSEAQFSELVKSGFAQEVLTDGIPAYQISSIPGEVVARMPRRIDYLARALVSASEMLRDDDFFALIAFASQGVCLIEQTPGKEHARLRQAAAGLESLNLGDGTQIDVGLELALEATQRLPGGSLATRLLLLTDGHTQNVRRVYELAEQAKRAGVKITTMGIGSEFNEDLLIPLADLTGGKAYFIETPEKIGEVLRQELGSALHIGYRNLEVKLLLTDDVSIRRAHRILPEIGEFDAGPGINGSYALHFGDYDPSQPEGVLLELVVEDGEPGLHRLAQVVLQWDDPEDGSRRQSPRFDIEFERSAVGIEFKDEEIRQAVDRVGAYIMGRQALEAAQSVRDDESAPARQAATIRLRQAATRMLDMGEPELAGEFLEQADLLERQADLDQNAAKKLRYKTRRLFHSG